MEKMRRERYAHGSLHEACQKGNEFLVVRLVERGVNVNEKNVSQRTALHYCCNREKIWIAKYLLDHGADATSTAKGGWTVLHEAARMCNEELVQLLIERGADVTAKDQSGETPLEFICGIMALNNIKATAQQLIRNGIHLLDTNIEHMSDRADVRAFLEEEKRKQRVESCCAFLFAAWP